MNRRRATHGEARQPEAFEPTRKLANGLDSDAPSGARGAETVCGEALHGLCITTGLQVLRAMMEGDREDLCEPKGRASGSSGPRSVAGAWPVR